MPDIIAITISASFPDLITALQQAQRENRVVYLHGSTDDGTAAQVTLQPKL